MKQRSENVQGRRWQGVGRVVAVTSERATTSLCSVLPAVVFQHHVEGRTRPTTQPAASLRVRSRWFMHSPGLSRHRRFAADHSSAKLTRAGTGASGVDSSRCVGRAGTGQARATARARARQGKVQGSVSLGAPAVGSVDADAGRNHSYDRRQRTPWSLPCLARALAVALVCPVRRVRVRSFRSAPPPPRTADHPRVKRQRRVAGRFSGTPTQAGAFTCGYGRGSEWNRTPAEQPVPAT